MRGCLWRLFRLLVLGAILFGLLVIFLPQFLALAGSSLLNSTNSSATPVSGLALYVPANFLDKNNKLQISLSGLDANKKYEVTLDPGACGSYGNVDVGPVTSDSSGNVTATFSLAPLNSNSGGWFVDVHSGAAASDSVMACSQLNTNNASAAAEVANTTLQLSPAPSDLTSAQVTPGLTTTNTSPRGFPQTGVAPGGSNSYDNNVYPRKF